MIDTTGKCSVCGQTVGIDTIHTCSPQAPRPRVEGEAVLTRNTRVLPGKLFDGDWIAVPEEDFVAARSRFAALTAEVERLRGEMAVASRWAAEQGRGVQAAYFAALSLPTPAPEAKE